MTEVGAKSAEIAFTDLTCLRGGRLVFERLSGRIGPGGALMIEGPNGAGKSSLLRLLAGLLRPAAGSIERQGTVGLADERPALDPHLPLGRALGWWAALDGRSGAEVARGLTALGLGALTQVPVRLLSTGQRRRAGLARLIASGQAIWLLDEPADGLDTTSRDALATAMAAHRAAGGLIVAASHQPLGLAAPDRLSLG